jgi:mannan endo-1,4-beta-mannosidase
VSAASPASLRPFAVPGFQRATPAARTTFRSTTSTTATTTPMPPPPRCEDFATQPQAQQLFDSDPAKYAYFDGDGDGEACEQLPGKPPAAPPAPVPVPTMAELRQPTLRLYGVHTRQAPFFMGEVDEFARAAGKMPGTVLFFANLSQPYPADAVSASWARGMLPMISLEPIIENSTTGQPPLRDIYQGRYDDFFHQWAAALRQQGLPVALRLAHEMNGFWYPWAEGVNGNAPGDYVKTWRYLHDLFAADGVTNALWVWSVNRIDTLPNKAISPFYPGSDYVDWVGMNGYLRQDVPGQAPSFAATFNETLGALRTVAPGKPIMITETSANTGEATRVEWINSFFQGLLQHPEVFGFVWFNEVKDSGDWTIQYSAATTAAFAAGVADPRYGSGVPPP